MPSALVVRTLKRRERRAPLASIARHSYVGAAVVAAALLLAATVSAHAAGLTVFGQDGFALGRADAFTATADNAAALYYNPAGITQLARPEARFGSYGVTYQGEFRTPGGANVDSERKFAAVPHSYAVLPLPERRLALGIATYAPFGLGMRWPESSGFRSVAMDAKLEYVTVQPTLAWQVLGEPGARAGDGQRLSVAVGPMLNYARTELRQGLTATAGNDYFRFKGDGFGFGVAAGVLWQPVAEHSFGVAYRSATRVDYDGHTRTVSVAPAFELREDARAEFEFPHVVTVGWSWRPSAQWNLEANVNWTGWSAFDSVAIRQATPVAPLNLGWEDARHYALGATRTLAEGWHVSGGYEYAQPAVPAVTFTPLVPDGDRHSVSAGVGRRTGRWSWDVAYQFTYGPPRTITGSTATAAGQTADGTYRLLSHGISISGSWLF